MNPKVLQIQEKNSLVFALASAVAAGDKKENVYTLNPVDQAPPLDSYTIGYGNERGKNPRKLTSSFIGSRSKYSPKPNKKKAPQPVSKKSNPKGRPRFKKK